MPGGWVAGIVTACATGKALGMTSLAAPAPAWGIWSEEKSLNTFENAFYGAQALRARKVHRVALVTEAYHMLRAERCLREQGIEVAPAPCSFRSRFRVRPEHLFGAHREAFDWTLDAAHEMGGLAWYWLRRRI